MRCGGVSTSKTYFLFTITIRLEVQFVVFLCNITTRNEGFSRNSPFSCKETIEMLQIILFVAMHPIGPLHDPVTWYGINYTGTQLSKQRKVRLDWYEFLCFESPTG